MLIKISQKIKQFTNKLTINKKRQVRKKNTKRLFVNEMKQNKSTWK